MEELSLFKNIFALGFSTATLLVLLFLITRAVKADVRFCSPIGAIVLRSAVDDDYSGLRIFGSYTFLFLIYVGYASAISISGGTIGASLLTGVFTEDANFNFGELNIIFGGGLIATGLARWCAVYVSAAVGAYFQYLGAWILASIVFLIIGDFEVFWEVMMSLNHASAPDLIWRWLLSALVVFGTVEGAIKIFSQWKVPYSLLTERIEECATIKQVFGGKKVPFTTDRWITEYFKNVGHETILNGEVLWVTNEPPNHLETIVKALTSRSDNRFNEASARKWVRLKTRVIVSPHALNIDRIYKHVPRWRVREGSSCFRVRFFVINRSMVIVHLPMPFHGKDGERANVMYLINSPPQIAIWMRKFGDLFRSLELPKNVQEINLELKGLPGIGPETEAALVGEGIFLSDIADWSKSDVSRWERRWPNLSRSVDKWPAEARKIFSSKTRSVI